MSNSFNPDQDRQNVGPDLGLNCLQMLSTDDKKLPRKELYEGHPIKNETFFIV